MKRQWVELGRENVTYPFAIRIVKGLQLNNVGMSDNTHDLQLSILVIVSYVISFQSKASHTLNLLS